MTVSQKTLKLLTLILFIGLIVLAAVYIISPKLKRQGQETAKVAEEGETESAAETVPLAVEASPARIGDLVMRISATGFTEAIRQVVVTPKWAERNIRGNVVSEIRPWLKGRVYFTSTKSCSSHILR